MALEAIICIYLKEKNSEIWRERLERNYVKTKTNSIEQEKIQLMMWHRLQWGRRYFHTPLMVDNVKWYFDMTVFQVDTKHLQKFLSSRARGQGKRRVCYLRHFGTYYILPLPYLVLLFFPQIPGVKKKWDFSPLFPLYLSLNSMVSPTNPGCWDAQGRQVKEYKQSFPRQ